MGDDEGLPVGTPAVEWAPGEAVAAPVEVPQKGGTEIERDTWEVKKRRAHGPWHFAPLCVPRLWSRTRGEGVRVGLLDSGLTRDCGAFDEEADIETFDHRGKPTKLGDRDREGHGTACASLIVSAHPWAPGVAPRVSLRSYDVSNGSGSPDVEHVETAVQAAVAAGCDLLSCSFIFRSPPPSLLDTFRRALDAGVVAVAAAGNDPAAVSLFPEDLAGAVVVGGYDRSGSPLLGQRKKFTDTLLPGDELPVILSTGALGVFGMTSAATALASGILALLLSAVHPRPRPGRTMDRLVSGAGDPSSDGGPPYRLDTIRLLDRMLSAGD